MSQEKNQTANAEEKVESQVVAKPDEQDAGQDFDPSFDFPPPQEAEQPPP